MEVHEVDLATGHVSLETLSSGKGLHTDNAKLSRKLTHELLVHNVTGVMQNRGRHYLKLNSFTKFIFHFNFAAL